MNPAASGGIITERSGIYDVTVKSEGGEVIAEFRGQVRLIPGTLVAEA